MLLVKNSPQKFQKICGERSSKFFSIWPTYQNHNTHTPLPKVVAVCNKDMTEETPWGMESWKMSFNKSWGRSNFAIYPSKSLEPYEEHRRHTRKTHDQALTNGENLFLVRTCQSATTRSHWFFSQEHVEMRLTKLRELTLFWLTSIGVVVLAVLVGLKDYDIPVLCLCHFLKDTKLQTV